MGGRFRADIQGLRAIAVAAVVLQHAGVAIADGGHVGVDVFFVVSGFLITGMLVRELETSGRIDIPAFAARRARRILPAALVVVVLTCVAVLVVAPPLQRKPALLDALASALFVPNYVFAARGTDYFADDAPSAFQHYWSLGVEEQWYLVCPLLLILASWVGVKLFRVARIDAASIRRRAAAVLMAAVTVASFAACVVLTDVSQSWAFFSLWTRAWEFGVGALVALLPAALLRQAPRGVAALLGWAGVAGVVISVTALGGVDWPGAAALLPVLSTAAVILCGSALAARSSETAGWWAPGRLLGTRPMLFLGAISYSLYLVHWPLLQLGRELSESRPVILAIAAAGVPIAWALYRGVEQPMRRARRLGRGPRRSLLAAAAATGAIALVVVALQWVPLAQTATAREVAHVAPSDPPPATDFVPANIEPSLEEALGDEGEPYAQGCNLGYEQAEPAPCVYGEESGERIVLWGDSHAAHWAPALVRIAETEGLRLETNTKSGCSAGFARHVLEGDDYEACDDWRTAVLDDLAADPPSVLVVAGFSWEVVPDGEDATTQWREGLREIVDALPGTRVEFIVDTPSFAYDPVECLAENLYLAGSCAIRADDALGGPGTEAMTQVAAETAAETIDMNGYLCGEQGGERMCPAIIGGRLVYRDSHHLTATFSRQLADPLAAELGVDG